MIKRVYKRTISFFLICLIVLVSYQNQFGIVKADSAFNTNNINLTYGSGETGYKAYLNKYKESNSPSDVISVNLKDFVCSEGYAKIAKDIGGKQGESIETKDEGFIEWQVNIENEGLYNIGMDYFPREGKGSAIVRTFKIDGQIPFDEAGNLKFTRSFTNAGAVIKDIGGNEIRPSQIEKPIWLSVDLQDNLGYFNEPLNFYFSKGKHTIGLLSVREPMIIGNIKIYRSNKAPKYSVAFSEYKKNGYENTTGQKIIIEGENADLKSDNTIYPINDNSSPATSPNSYSKLLLNTIGGQKWLNNDQWVEWNFNVPKTGLYKLGIKARQNIVSGQPSYRKIYIDEKCLFEELENVKFPYDTQWRMFALGEENPYLFYLKEGTHTVKMEVTLGEMSTIIEKVNSVMNELNATYMNFLMVTGPNPDINRDYAFDKALPNELVALGRESEELKAIYNDLLKLNGMGGMQAQLIDTLAKQTEKMSKNPEKIGGLFNDFVTNLSSLGSLIATLKQQPLEIDYIEVASPDVAFEKPTKGIIENFSFAIQQFIASFYINYSNIGALDNSTAAIKVWISSGRDQANALSLLIKNYFTAKNNIKVNMQLVPAGTLISATLANKGPDVALSNAQSDPLNYAIRKAVVDLSEFEGFSEVAKRFRDSALEPMRFNGKVYGIPETQNFPMMFYRKDILKKLNIEVPKTWDDVISIIPLLQKKHLNFGLPQPYVANAMGSGFGTYAMFLYQMDGSFYNEKGTKSLLDSNSAIDAFYKWTDFYNNYSLPTQYDFNTRFRSGEIPIGIADYSTYNVLSVFAPELEGVWAFAPVPGTKKADGSLDRKVAATATATIMMSKAVNKKDAWKFIDWWTTADTQERYGNELESIMGVAAR
jgi:ABC-type glycerol-3-phosphate transport system substrate-binding protein